MSILCMFILFPFLNKTKKTKVVEVVCVRVCDLIPWQTMTTILNSTVPMCMFLASCAQDKLCHQLDHSQSCMCGITKAGVLGLFGLCERKGDRPPAIVACPLWVPSPAFQLGAKYGFFHVGLISFKTPANIERDSVQTQTHLLSYSPPLPCTGKEKAWIPVGLLLWLVYSVL